MEKEPKLRCTCVCHSNPNISHVMACCENGYIVSPFSGNLKENINKDIDLEAVNKTIELQKEMIKRMKEVDWSNLYNVIII